MVETKKVQKLGDTPVTDEFGVSNYRVLIGIKMPIPGIDYSNVNVEVACEGADVKMLTAEAKKNVYSLIEEVINDITQE